MAKDAFYFPHDYEATNDPKLQALVGEFGAAGYGIYSKILSYYIQRKRINYRIKNISFWQLLSKC